MDIKIAESNCKNSIEIVTNTLLTCLYEKLNNEKYWHSDTAKTPKLFDNFRYTRI